MMGPARLSSQVMESPAAAVTVARVAFVTVPAPFIVKNAVRGVDPAEMAVQVFHSSEPGQIHGLPRERVTGPSLPPGADIDHESIASCREDARIPEILRDGAGRHAVTVQSAVNMVFFQDCEPAPQEFREFPVTVEGDEKPVSLGRHGDLKLQVPAQVKLHDHGNPVQDRLDPPAFEIGLRDGVRERSSVHSAAGTGPPALSCSRDSRSRRSS